MIVMLDETQTRIRARAAAVEMMQQGMTQKGTLRALMRRFGADTEDTMKAIVKGLGCDLRCCPKTPVHRSWIV